MIKPQERDIGRRVVYRTHDGLEEGVITSFNDGYVFVRYGNNDGSAATKAHDLEWWFPIDHVAVDWSKPLRRRRDGVKVTRNRLNGKAVVSKLPRMVWFDGRKSYQNYSEDGRYIWGEDDRMALENYDE